MGLMPFQIHIAKHYLGFSAAHFITYDGHKCETLHGHNYRVRLRLEAALDENHYVIDFTRVKKLMKQLCDALDHRMLLPLHNTILELEQTPESVTVRYKHRRFVFPHEDVLLLPLPNTTAEMLAQYLCGQALPALHQMSAAPLKFVEVEVEEAPGQAAVYREEFTSEQ
jgi:6-pyruvoyltetrahydropterin/6-carboxytetrahydropterin synthase